MVTKQLCQTLLSKQFVLMLFSDYSLTKKKHSNFKQTEQDKLKKDKKTHRAVIKTDNCKFCNSSLI